MIFEVFRPLLKLSLNEYIEYSIFLSILQIICIHILFQRSALFINLNGNVFQVVNSFVDLIRFFMLHSSFDCKRIDPV